MTDADISNEPMGESTDTPQEQSVEETIDNVSSIDDFVYGETPEQENNEEILEEPVEENVEATETVETTTEEVEQNPSDVTFYQKPEFENSEQELDWYRNKMGVLEQIFDKDKGYLQEFIETTRTDAIHNVEQEVQGFRDMFEAMQVDPKGFLLQYMPEAMAEYGIDPIMSSEQLLERVQADMESEFGADYLQKVNPQEMFKPRSFSSQVWAKQQESINHWTKLNERNQELVANWNKHIKHNGGGPQPLSEVEAVQKQEQYLSSEYQNYFAPKLGYSKEQFDSFIEQAQKAPSLTLQQVEKVLNFDKYMQQSYERGIRERGKNTLNQVVAEKAKPVATPPTQNSADEIHREFVQAFMNGGIPTY